MSSKTEAELLELINTTPELKSLLYDISMMPEQIMRESPGGLQEFVWGVMLAFAHLWHMAMEKYEPEIEQNSKYMALLTDRMLEAEQRLNVANGLLTRCRNNFYTYVNGRKMSRKDRNILYDDIDDFLF